MANVPDLAELLSSMPYDKLHLPHAARPSLVELRARGGPGRIIKRRILTAMAQTSTMVATALHSTTPSVSSQPGPPISLQNALALQTLLPTLLLQLPEKGRSLPRSLDERLNKWDAGKWKELFELAEIIDSAGHWRLGEPGWRSPVDRRPATNSTRTANAQQRAYQHATAKQLGRANQVLTPGDRADPADPNNLQKLRDLHPTPSHLAELEPNLDSDDDLAAVRTLIRERCTVDKVVAMIRQSPRFSQPGPDQ